MLVLKRIKKENVGVEKVYLMYKMPVAAVVAVMMKRGMKE